MSLGDLYRRGASVRVGDWTGISAREFAAEMMSVKSYIDGIMRDMDSAAAAHHPLLTPEFKASWTDFIRRWDNFYRATAASVDSLMLPQLSGARDTLLRYSEEAQQWAQALRDVNLRRTHAPASLPTAPPPSPPWELPSLNPLKASAGALVWGLLALGGLTLLVLYKQGYPRRSRSEE